MIKIDENALRNDLIYTLIALSMMPNRDFVKRNYDDFVSLYTTYDMIYGKPILVNNPDCLEVAKSIMDETGLRGYRDYLFKVKGSIAPIINCASSSCKINNDLDFYNIRYLDAIRKYSEADFKDLILGYYSTYGNDYYKIAKKYFDEYRILSGLNNPKTEKKIAEDFEHKDTTNIDPSYLYDGQIRVKDLIAGLKFSYEEDEDKSNSNSNNSNSDVIFSSKSKLGGFFSSIQWLETGYIFNLKNKYDSASACNVVHELGHAIDAERFLFSQRKKIEFMDDIFSEIPSFAMEYGFYDYLKDNRIDVDGSRIIKNGSEESLFLFSLITMYVIDNPDFFVGYNGDVYDSKNKRIDFRFSILYGIGNYMALHLNQIRREDPKEYLRVYNDLMTLRREATYKQLIEMAGFDYDKYTSGYYIKNEIENDFLELKKRYGH